MSRSKHPDDLYRSRTAREDEPKDLPQSLAPAKDSPGHPAIDAADKAPKTPWRHPHLICPCCAGGQVERVARQGVWDYLLSSIYIYPFRCESCSHGFRVFEWGVRYRRQRRY